MNFSRILSAAACACLMGLAVVSCTDPGTGGGGTTTVVIPDPVSNLQATSVDDATVRLRWTGSTSSTVTGFRVTVVSSTGTVVGTVTPTSSLVDIGGLTAGRVYTFKVQTRGKDTVVSAERTINWSPATRIRMASGGAVRLYESLSSFGSGLSFQGGVAQNLSIANAVRWDIGLDTRANTAGQITFDIGSPNKTSYSAFTNDGGRKTIVSAMVYNTIERWCC
jgi:Fibronectin type III domain